MLAAMVLAAGLGTRLRPLTDFCAKPLVPVGDQPALAHVLARLRAAGVPRVVVNAHHRADDVVRYAREQPWPVAVSAERDLLGTAGGVARAAALLGAGEVLVWNADVLAEVDVAGVAEAHALAGAEATLVVAPRARGEGTVGVGAGGEVVRLRGERFGEEREGADFVGISVLAPSLRATLPERGCLVADVWLPRLRRGGGVRVFRHGGGWRDIGTVASYLAANLDWLRARRLAHWLGNGASADARVHLEESVLGRGARAEGAGLVARSVVWPDSVATAPLADVVVLPGQVVPS